MRILALDLSIRTGAAVFDTNAPTLLIDAYNLDYKHQSPLSTNLMEKPQKESKRKRNLLKYDPSNHPKDFMEFVNLYIDELMIYIENIEYLDEIVLEQTNKGRDRWRQKLLEWLHYELCKRLKKLNFKTYYIDTMEWHRILEIKISKEERKQNKKIRTHNKDPKNKRMIGITDQKRLAMNWAEKKFDLVFKRNENDIADAICLGYAYLMKKNYIIEEV